MLRQHDWLLSLNFCHNISLKPDPDSWQRRDYAYRRSSWGWLTFVGLAVIRKQPYIFKDFFKGLSNKYFLQIFLISLVGGAITALGILLLIIPGIYIAVSYSFAVQIAIDWELDFWEALEASRKLISKNWFSMFGFILVLTLINMAGILALGVGIIFTAPLTICTLLVAYDDILGNHNEPQLSDSW
jgi:uncharacterized membrane protein